MRTYHYFIFAVIFIAAACTSNTNNPEEPFRLLWEFAYRGEPEGLSLVTLAPEIVDASYVAISPDRRITNLDQKTGEVVWSNKLPGNAWISTNTLLRDSDTFYIKIDQTSKIIAWDILTGSKRWEGELPSGTFFDFRHDGQDNQKIYLTGNQASFFVFSKQGEFLLEKKMDKNPRAIISDGTNLYVSQAWRPENSDHAAGRIVAFDSESFQKRWEYETDKGGFYDVSILIQNNVLYAGTTEAVGDGEFVAINVETGEAVWKKIGEWTWSYNVSDSTLFLNNGIELIALEKQTGQELWRSSFGGGHSQDNIAYLNGYLYHSHGSGLFILDAGSGEIVHKEPIAPDGTPFGNVAAANGRVFAQSDYHLYAYEAWTGE